MKKILVLLFISFASFAQTEKGMFTAGSQVFKLSSGLNSDYRFFELSPSVGKLIRNNLEYGVSLYILNIKQKYSNNSGSKFGFLNYFTKYFGSKKTQPYISIGFGPMLATDENLTIGVNLSTGVQYFVSPNLSLGIYAGLSDLELIGPSTSMGANFRFYFLPKNKPLKTLDL